MGVPVYRICVHAWGSPGDFTMISQIYLCANASVFSILGHLQRASSHLAHATDRDTNKKYAKAAVYALQKYADVITNISAVQVSPELYSNWLISADTFSMICSNSTINKNQILLVYEDLKSRVAVNSPGFVKFVDILRGYPEYERLANDLQGLYEP